MTAVAVDFHNIPGAMMRVLNCFTRRGLLLQAVWCGPAGDHHRAQVLVEAQPITVDQIVRELESTVGVDRVERLAPAEADQLSQGRAPEALSGDNGFRQRSELPSQGAEKPLLFREERKFVAENWERLEASYRGRYIAILGTTVLDSDPDFSALAERVLQQIGPRRIFMPFIEKSERVFHLRSPHIIS